jgi:hypothetical protein
MTTTGKGVPGGVPSAMLFVRNTNGSHNPRGGAGKNFHAKELADLHPYDQLTE